MAWGEVARIEPDSVELDENILNEIRVAVAAIASARGLVADLRVTLLGGTTAVTGTLTAVTTVTTVTTVTSVTNQAQMGGLPLNTAVPNWQNTLAVSAFVANIGRP